MNSWLNFHGFIQKVISFIIAEFSYLGYFAHPNPTLELQKTIKISILIITINNDMQTIERKMKNTPTPLPVIGIIGLGIMGGIMAETLLLNQYSVIGYDIEKTACQRLKQAGGKVCKSVSEVTQQADVVITSLATSGALTCGLCGNCESFKRAA
jgi:hypothetical protein